jgi:hypothetical protein
MVCPGIVPRRRFGIARSPRQSRLGAIADFGTICLPGPDIGSRKIAKFLGYYIIAGV